MLKSCILMRCCCATRAEQELLQGQPWGAEPAQHKFLSPGWFLLPTLLPPGQQLLLEKPGAGFASSTYPAGPPTHSLLFCPTSAHNLLLIPRSAPPCLTLDVELNSGADLGHEELESTPTPSPVPCRGVFWEVNRAAQVPCVTPGHLDGMAAPSALNAHPKVAAAVWLPGVCLYQWALNNFNISFSKDRVVLHMHKCK